jgi:hypothetical protein
VTKGCSLYREGHGELEHFVNFTLRQATAGLVIAVAFEDESLSSCWCWWFWLELRRGRVLMLFVLSLSCRWNNWRSTVVCLLERKGRLLKFSSQLVGMLAEIVLFWNLLQQCCQTAAGCRGDELAVSLR